MVEATKVSFNNLIPEITAQIDILFSYKRLVLSALSENK